jgi:hypothetical protein
MTRSGCGRRVEAIQELDEHFLEAGLVVVGVRPDECDHLPVTVGSLAVLATGLIDHAESIVAIVHDEQIDLRQARRFTPAVGKIDYFSLAGSLNCRMRTGC